MKLKTFAIAVALALAIFLFAQRRATPVEPPLFSSIIDLTHAQAATARTTEGERGRLVPRPAYKEAGTGAATAADTRLDAPARFAPGRWTVAEIPAERLVRPLVVIDVSARVRNDPDYRAGVDDIAEWEHVHGHIPAGALVLLRTGWDAHWASQQRYRNADAQGVMHFPGYSLDAARFLVEARDAVGLGIDTLSIDSGASREFPVHRYCAEHSVYYVENLANLEVAPPSGALAVVSPAKIEGESGAPARVLAMRVSTPPRETR
jgi:kynurenine formamidase